VDLNLDVRLGEVFGFLGPNGAGKTTMIRTIMDEIRPTAGRASILGMDSHVKSVEIRRHIGYLPDDLALYPNLTGRDTLTYFANLRGGVDWGLRGPAGRAAGRRPVQEGGGSVLRQSAEGRGHPGLHEPPASVDHGRAERGAGPTGAVGATRQVELEFGSPVDRAVFESVPGTRGVTVEDRRALLSYDGKMEALLKAVTESYDVVDISTQEADLEEIFLTYYRDDQATV
jgi:ABC-2 type transport system ATP-binding protein